MAVVSATRVGPRTPCGNYFRQTYSVTPGSGAAADEWFVTTFHELISVTYAPIGTGVNSANFVLGAQGTGQAAGSTLGSVGFEGSTTVPLHVTVIGR